MTDHQSAACVSDPRDACKRPQPPPGVAPDRWPRGGFAPPETHLVTSVQACREAWRPLGAAIPLKQPAECCARHEGAAQEELPSACRGLRDIDWRFSAREGRQGCHPPSCQSPATPEPACPAAMQRAACSSTPAAVWRAQPARRQQRGSGSRAASTHGSAAAWLHRPRSSRRLQARQGRQTRGQRRWRGAAAASAAYGGDSLFSSSERLRVLTS